MRIDDGSLRRLSAFANGFRYNGGTKGRVDRNWGNTIRARFHAFSGHYIFIAEPSTIMDTVRIRSNVYAAELHGAFSLGRGPV